MWEPGLQAPESGPERAGRWPPVTQQKLPFHHLLWPRSQPVLPAWVSGLLAEPRSSCSTPRWGPSVGEKWLSLLPWASGSSLVHKGRLQKLDVKGLPPSPTSSPPCFSLLPSHSLAQVQGSVNTHGPMGLKATQCQGWSHTSPQGRPAFLLHPGEALSQEAHCSSLAGHSIPSNNVS